MTPAVARASSSLLRTRLQRQGLADAPFATPLEVVSWLGAVQSQDYAGSLWAIGLRMQDATEALVEQAIVDRHIVRTWPMRGTLHLVAAADVRWMLRLLAPRVLAGNAARIEREHGLDAAALKQCRKLVEKTLRDGLPVTRSAFYRTLEDAGITTANQRGIHIVGQLAHAGVICGGPRDGRQPTFVLLDAWLPPTAPKTRDEALAEVALRYIRSHGPATARDFAWWAGLTVKDAQAGIASVQSQLRLETLAGKAVWLAGDAIVAGKLRKGVHLLPPFDEYLVAYKDRSDALDAVHHRRVIGPNGLFGASIVVDGRVVGVWKRTQANDRVTIALSPFESLTKGDQAAIARGVRAYGRFLGRPVEVDPPA